MVIYVDVCASSVCLSAPIRFRTSIFDLHATSELLRRACLAFAWCQVRSLDPAHGIRAFICGACIPLLSDLVLYAAAHA
eukprot:6173297-Pleurochrysis_carterae.AAC.5